MHELSSSWKTKHIGHCNTGRSRTRLRKGAGVARELVADSSRACHTLLGYLV